jgi:hypothetical protein
MMKDTYLNRWINLNIETQEMKNNNNNNKKPMEYDAFIFPYLKLTTP